MNKEVEKEVLGYIPARQRMTDGVSERSVDRKDLKKFLKKGFQPIAKKEAQDEQSDQ